MPEPISDRPRERPSRAPDSPARIAVRPLRSLSEYLACVELQKETWGNDFHEVVPATILQVVQRIGGIAAGAFDNGDRLLGFVFGMTGVEGGRLVHWSDMLAVRRDAQNLGVGRQLKEFQKEYLRRIGVELVYWTFDPLVARNAHLNLNRLGARVVEYVPNMYGDTASTLHQGLGTDRFVVVWEIASAKSSGGLSMHPAEIESAPVVNIEDIDMASGAGRPRADAPVVRIRIPPDISAIQAASLEEAGLWRATSRRLFQWYLGRGYQVAGFDRGGVAGPSYCLVCRPSSQEETR